MENSITSFTHDDSADYYFECHCVLCCEDDAGDPFTGLIDPNIDPAIIEQKRIAAGYYDPIPVQYFRWVGNLCKEILVRVLFLNNQLLMSSCSA